MASPLEMHETVAAGDTVCGLDEQTLNQTPHPRAASTSLRRDVPKNQRIPELVSFVNSAMEESDQSSLGLLPCNLMLDLSNLNASNNISLSSTFNKSKKASCLPSIPESPHQLNSPRSLPVEGAHDDVLDTAADVTKRTSVVSGSGLPRGSATNLSLAKFSFSNLSQIEFRDDQISARSSTAESNSQLSHLSRDSKANDTSMPSTFSHLFSRHSLDVSAFTTPLPVMPATESVRETLKVLTFPAAQIQGNSGLEVLENAASRDRPRTLGKDPAETCGTDEDPKFFFNLGEMRKSPSALSQNSIEFIQGGDILDELEKDEGLLEKENFLLIPPQKFNNGSEVGMDHLLSVALGSSWLASVNHQDITRPSWFSGEDEDVSRISIGKFISARTEKLGKWDDDNSRVEDGPDFGIPVIASPRNGDDGLVSVQPADSTSKIQDVETRQDEPKTTAGKGMNVLSHSAISALIADASLSADRDELAKLVVQATLKGKRTCHQAPGVSDHERVEILAEIATPVMTGTKVASHTPCEKKDKVVQVSFESCQLPNLPSFQRTSPTPPPSSVPIPAITTSRVTSFGISQSPSAALLKLQADLHDLKPSVVVPSEVIVEEPCCVGVSVESSIKLQNSSARWLEASVVIQKLACNGQSWNLEAVPPVIRLNSSCILDPHSAHHLKVIFFPPKEGRWEAYLQVFFRNLSPLSTLTAHAPLLDWCSYPPICLRANAENPNFSVIPNDVLDFGVLPEECLSICHLQLLNNGKAKLPVRLVIEGSPGAGQGFYFPNDGSSASSSCAMQILSSCVLSCVLSSANYYSAKIPIAFKAPTLSQSGEDTQTVTAGLRIEMDTPSPLPMLSKLSLRAVIGIVKLYIRPDDEIIEFLYPLSATKIVPLCNAGAIPLKLELSTLDSQQLSVTPPSVNVPAGEQVNVQLAYRPLDLGDPLQSGLQIKVLPGGPTYKIAICARVRSHPPLTQSSAASGDKLALHSDRRYIYWGTVDLGQAVAQHFTLRNVSPSEQLYLTLKIKAHEGCREGCPFQMVDEIATVSSLLTTAATSNSSHKLVSQKSITMHPGEELPVKVYFAPVQAAAYSAKLIIRPRRPAQYGAVLTSSWVKFSIPLRGYGGLAILNYEGLRSTELQAPFSLHVPTLSGPPLVISSSTHGTIKAVVGRTDLGQAYFNVRNCGHRAAFVKIIPSNDKNIVTSLPSWISVDIQPSEFVIAEGHSHTVKVSVHTQYQSAAVFLIVIFGEDILRHRFRLLQPSVPATPEDAVLRSVLRLHEVFPNEIPLRSNETDPLWPACQADRSKLVSALKTTLVMVDPGVHAIGALRPAPCPNVLDDHLSEGFAPLVAEETFSDVTLLLPSFVGRNVPTSPPIKEKSPLTTKSEGIIQLEPTNVIFPRTACGHSSTFKVTLKNIGYGQNLEVNILKPASPFHVNHNQVVIKPKHYLSLPVFFRPTEAGAFSSTLLLYPNAGPNPITLAVSLRGEAL